MLQLCNCREGLTEIPQSDNGSLFSINFCIIAVASPQILSLESKAGCAETFGPSLHFRPSPKLPIQAPKLDQLQFQVRICKL